MISRADDLLWIALPYLSIALFLGGLAWRYRRDQFGWTTRSSQLLESRWLAWGSVLFHYGALAVIGGHVFGILVPASAMNGIGVTEDYYHWISMVAGTATGVICSVGLVILVFRRIAFPRITRATTRMDVLAYTMLLIMVGLGMGDTLGINTIGGGYDYRQTVSVWFRGIFAFHPHPDLMSSAPIVYQAHATAAWVFFAIFPFTRFVHAFSVPLQYLGRPYILYRRRWSSAR